MDIQYPSPRQEYKVLVRCYTYNHGKYIEDALNGFAMQKTDFPFVCLVVDDASTDGEQEVIKSWMECECDMNKAETIDIPTSIVIIVPHKNNEFCTFAFYLLKQNLYRVKGEKKKHVEPWRRNCKYEAFCEGDDYWIDPHKLQKQVVFLDNNEEYGLVCSDYNVVDSKNIYIRSSKSFFKEIYTKDLLLDNPISTATACVRSEFVISYYENISNNNFKMGDLPLWIYVSLSKKIIRIKDITTAYRLLDNSASHSDSEAIIAKFTKNEFDIRFYFIDAFCIKINKNMVLKRYYQILTRKMAKFDNSIFFKYYFKYIKMYPSALLDLKTNILFIMKLMNLYKR